ncbi:MAG: acyl-CoA dehydrogenase family protein [Henriciella sp.]
MASQERHPVYSAAQELIPELKRRATEMEAARRLPADLAQTMAEAGLFRLVVPAALGGYEASPAEIVEIIAALSEANASAGWCVMIGATTAMNAAYLPVDIAAEIYGDPLVITGGVFAPMGKAVSDGDDYIVSGQWQWASGSANCEWLCAGAIIYDGDEMRLLPSGRPDTRMMIFPRAQAELIDSWHVMGLQGTGSGDFRLDGISVPKARTVSLVTDHPRQSGGLYAFPPFGLLSLGVAAVAMGNAAGALSDFRDLASAKKSQGSSKTLSERANVQAEMARLTAQYRAARAYLESEVAATWNVAEANGDIPVERRAALRMACTHMVRVSADLCRSVYDMGGGAALFSDSPLQRRFRDSHAITQHIVTAPATWELTGRLLFDLPTDAAMV